MKKNASNVVFGFLGQTMDSVSARRGKFAKRFERWRPTVSLVQHPEDLPIKKLVLIHHSDESELKDIVAEDILSIAPTIIIETHQINFDSPWDFNTVFPKLYEFVAAYPFDVEKERYFFHLTTGSNIQQASVFLMVGARYFPGSLLQSGPDKSSDIGSKLDIIDLDNAPKAVADIFRQRQQQDTEFLKLGIATRNAAFNDMIQQIERVAIRSKAPLLITGPTGAGKSNLASLIYDLKKQRYELTGEFVEINCATIVGDNSAMSALFGHTKGAFTGAASKRDGLLKRADGGLLFLDEVAELGTDEQAMLLRALETRRFYPLGSDSEVSSDFQLICGTNKDLRIEVREHRFREDLFARINLFTYELPGLKDRREDIEPNLMYELDRFQQEHGHRIHMMPNALTCYLQFALSNTALWKGNFRDLNASVMRMATLSESGVINENIVQQEIKTLEYLWGDGDSTLNNPDHLTDELIEQFVPRQMLNNMDRMEQYELGKVIEVCKQSRSAAEAGRHLFNVSRLHRRKPNDGARIIATLNKYNLNFEDLKS